MNQLVWLHLVRRVRAQGQVYHLSNVIDLANRIDSKFLHIDGLVQQYYNLSAYLSPTTRVLPNRGLQYFLEYHMLVLFMKTQFLIWSWDSKLVGIWTKISGTKRGYSNHWAALHLFLFLLFYVLCLIATKVAMIWTK